MMNNINRSPQQHRSRVTTKRFLDAARQLLQKQTYAEMSVNELAKKAKRSVGTFYQRFDGKDEFLNILMLDFFEANIEEDMNNWRGRTAKSVFTIFLKDNYRHICENKNLWHAALERSSTQPDFWSNFADLRTKRFDILLEAMEAGGKRKLTAAEVRRCAVAIQVFNSVINNQVINSPGPLSLDDDAFLPSMTTVALDIAKLNK
ncbi:MAG: TetR/AcrR family transcriptional regulator [Oricola sp.]|jgi:AcrR family transcriptional regulator|nr:TetR/AcrR family transcriptional regulator [Oricola sp.]